MIPDITRFIYTTCLIVALKIQMKIVFSSESYHHLNHLFIVSQTFSDSSNIGLTSLHK